jgi:hypothetical protein
MRTGCVTVTFALAFALSSLDAASAQQTNPAQVHLDHVSTAIQGTPEGRGLLPTALAEAQMAATHAGLAVRDPANLDAMKQHAGHVIHALDPTAAARGPGLGYGLKKAADGIATHIELASRAEGASALVIQHAPHIATSARNTVKRADEIIALAKRIQAAETAAAAAPLVAELTTRAQQLTSGVDANSDGQIGWQEGEGGLAQAEQHLNLILQGDIDG